MKSNSTRNHHWDNIKGILIILTVFAHILYQLQETSPLINYIVDIIYSFHMPAFIFVSGYFGKSERSRSIESLSTFVFLFLIFNSLTGYIYKFSSLLEPVHSYWYLLSLIIWRLTTPYLSKIKHIVPKLIFLAIIIGFHPSIDNTLALSRTIGFFPFYMLGYKFTMNNYNKLCESRLSKRLLFSAIILIITSLTIYYSFDFLSFSDSTFVLDPYNNKVDCIERLIMFFVSCLTILLILHISSRRNIPLLSMFGRNSLCIFVFHRPLTRLASSFLENEHIFSIFVSTTIITLLICCFFGNDFANKNLNKFAKSGAAILLQKSEGISLAKIALIIVFLGFIALSFVEPSVGLLKTFLKIFL